MHLIFHMLRWYFHKQFMTYLRSMNFPMRLVPSRVLSLYTSNSTPSAFFYYYYAGEWPLFKLFKFFKIFGFYSANTYIYTSDSCPSFFYHFNQTSKTFHSKEYEFYYQYHHYYINHDTSTYTNWKPCRNQFFFVKIQCKFEI